MKYLWVVLTVFLCMSELQLFANQDNETYLSELANQLRVDMDYTSDQVGDSKPLQIQEIGKTPSSLDSPQGDMSSYFTTIAEKAHPMVEYYIKYYSSFGKKKLEDFLEHFQDIFPIVKKYAIKNHLPLEVAIIPLVESGAYRDTIRYRRAGMWLLSEGIAQIYGLKMGEYLDERLDLEKSSQAALSYFSSLLQAFNNNWDFALTAFNGGGILLQKEIRDLQIDNFWDLLDKKTEISSDSLEYVPKFYALLTILKHPSRYGIHIPEMKDSDTVSFSEIPLVKSGVAFKDIARLTNVGIDKMMALNPQLSRQYTVAGATLYIPANTQYLMKSRIRVAKAIRLRNLSNGRGDGTSISFHPYSVGGNVSVAKAKRKKNPYYRIKAKDTLYGIAKKTRSSVQAILAQNKNLSTDSILRVGDLIKVAKVPISSRDTLNSSNGVHYTVKPGDTLYAIAKNYHVPVAKVLSETGASIKPGDDVVVLR